jgi:hypothetical protein
VLATTACSSAFSSVAKNGLAQARSQRCFGRAQLLSGLSPFVDELDEHGAMAWVVGALGGESAFVGVAVIELSEEHGVILGGAEGGPTLPSAITLASVSRNAAVQFSPAALNFGHFGRLLREVCLQTWAGGGLAAVSRRAVMPACRGSLTRRQPGASLPVFKGGTPAPNGVGHRSLVSMF